MANSFTYKDQVVHVGDTIKLHLNVTEGDKSRVQIFEGLVIAIKNSGTGKSFTIRKIGAGAIGVERIIPLNSPVINNIETKSLGSVRQAKIYYMRDRVGKKASKVKLKDPVKSTKPSKSPAPKKTASEPKTTSKPAKPGKSGRTASKKPSSK